VADVDTDSYEFMQTTYKEDLFIDKYNLDIEWLKQPMLFVKWAERWAEAVERRDRAKQYLEVIKAEMYTKIKKDPDVYGLPDKPTEGATNAIVTKSKKYRSAFEDYLDLNGQVNVLASAKEAMNHKKRALEYVSQLMLGGFYSNPNIKAEARQKVENEKGSEIRGHIKDSNRMQARSQLTDTENE